MDDNFEVNFHHDILATVRQPLIVLDPELRVITANRAYYQHFQCDPRDVEGQLLKVICNKKWDIPKLIELLSHILPEKTSFDNFEVESEFDHIGERMMLLNARKIYRDDNNTNMILLAIEDITQRKFVENALIEKIDELENVLSLMVGREVRMADLKKVITRLRLELKGAGISPVAHDTMLGPNDEW